ncbi:fasciclin domain-containing protein [Pedobacter sp. WC2501]|uniref:fasciclin domain-containing protein n=1 Tax=Pedobacter sp. WC2501 TaxID=3461400 RepID=UPI004045994B
MSYPHSKHHISLLFFGITCLLLSLSTGCKKDNPENFNKATPTLYQYIDTGQHFNLYRAALKRAGIYNEATFSNEGPFTVFVPIDSAFIKAGLNLENIEKQNPADLAALLKYSIVNGKLSSTSLLGFYSQAVTCANPDYRPTITKNYYGIFFNGIPVSAKGSISLNDGVVHELQRLPLLPAGNLYTTIAGMPNLSLFLAVLKRGGNDVMVKTGWWFDGRPITVLAPDNNAWNKLGYHSEADIENEDPDKLKNWILDNAYISPDVNLTANFKGGYNFNGEFLYVLADGMTLVSKGNVSQTRITQPDIIASNGVLHVIDQAFVQR